jgi:hypothetical protein
MNDEIADDTGLAELGEMIATLSDWIDGSYPADLIGTELHQRRRVDKLMEEAGEVGQALGGQWGENPRKGFTHTAGDVDGELLDVAVTALGAWESRNGNHGYVIAALFDKMDGLLKRVGLPASRNSRSEGDK